MRVFLVAAAVVLSMGVAGGASAAVFTYLGKGKGNECSAFNGFENCTYKGSPTVAKLSFDNGTPTSSQYNTTVFPSLNGSEFSVTLSANDIGTWSYTPGLGDPLIITAFIAKAGSRYYIYEWDETSGTDFTNIYFDTKDKKRALARITFFDTGVSPVPLPAAGLLLIASLGGLAAMGRRRKS